MRVWLLVLTCLLGLAPASPAQELRERATFKGPKFRVNQTAVSPDGKLFAVAAGDGRGAELKLWDATTGEEVAALGGYSNEPHAVAFSADGKRLAAGGMGWVLVWDVGTRKELAAFKDPREDVHVVAFSADGTRLAAVGWRPVRVWDVDSGKKLASFQHHIALHGGPGLAFSKDLATLAARNYQEIDLWDMATGKERGTLSEHRGEVGWMAFSPDGKTLVASSKRQRGPGFKWQGDVKLWDVATGKERAELPGPFGCVLAGALGPDGKTLALLDQGDIYTAVGLKLVDVATGRQRVVPAVPDCTFRSLGFTAGGQLLVIGTSGEALKLWEVSLPEGGRE
jgi:WD40 repeat protein